MKNSTKSKPGINAPAKRSIAVTGNGAKSPLIKPTQLLAVITVIAFISPLIIIVFSYINRLKCGQDVFLGNGLNSIKIEFVIS